MIFNFILILLELTPLYSQIICPDGHFLQYEFDLPFCITCLPGCFCHKDACSPCLDNYYSDTFLSTECKQCPNSMVGHPTGKRNTPCDPWNFEPICSNINGTIGQNSCVSVGDPDETKNILIIVLTIFITVCITACIIYKKYKRKKYTSLSTTDDLSYTSINNSN